jgi:hypothetical protein
LEILIFLILKKQFSNCHLFWHTGWSQVRVPRV